MTRFFKFAAPLVAASLIGAPSFAASHTETEETTTIATADIAGPIGADDLAADTIVMASTGEVVGKVVSIVALDTGMSDLIIQVAGTEDETPEKNVTLDQSRFMLGEDGNYVLDMDYEMFMDLVIKQNPA